MKSQACVKSTSIRLWDQPSLTKCQRLNGKAAGVASILAHQIFTSPNGATTKSKRDVFSFTARSAPRLNGSSVRNSVRTTALLLPATIIAGYSTIYREVPCADPLFLRSGWRFHANQAVFMRHRRSRVGTVYRRSLVATVQEEPGRQEKGTFLPLTLYKKRLFLPLKTSNTRIPAPCLRLTGTTTALYRYETLS